MKIFSYKVCALFPTQEVSSGWKFITDGIGGLVGADEIKMPEGVTNLYHISCIHI